MRCLPRQCVNGIIYLQEKTTDVPASRLVRREDRQILSRLKYSGPQPRRRNLTSSNDKHTKRLCLGSHLEIGFRISVDCEPVVGSPGSTKQVVQCSTKQQKREKLSSSKAIEWMLIASPLDPCTGT